MAFTACAGCDTFACLGTNLKLRYGFGDDVAVFTWFSRHFPVLCCDKPMGTQIFTNREEESYRLRCSTCKKTASIFASTPFKGMRTSPQQLVGAVILFCRGLQQTFISEFFELSPEVLARINAVIECLCMAYNFISYVDVSERNTFAEVQADESAIGARKYNVGARRRKDGILWIAGAVSVGREGVERMIGHVVQTRTANDLNPFLENVTDENSLVCVDGWKAYTALGKIRNLSVVNHRKGFVNSEGHNTNSCEGMWRHLKQAIKHRYHTVGTDSLTTTNARVQVGIFFVNCSLASVRPEPIIFQLILEHEKFLKIITEASRIQEEEAKITDPPQNQQKETPKRVPERPMLDPKHVNSFFVTEKDVKKETAQTENPAATAETETAKKRRIEKTQSDIYGCSCSHSEFGQGTIVRPMKRKAEVRFGDVIRTVSIKALERIAPADANQS